MMFLKLALFLAIAVSVRGSPFAKRPSYYIPRTITRSPNIKELPFENVVRSIVPPKKTHPSGTVKVEGCGQAPLANDKAKIVGGSEASPHSYPWQVALYIDEMYFCGGSIISEEWVLTAAHCMVGASSVEVVAGAHDLSKSESSQVSLTSREFSVHEDYVQLTDHNDIAIIQLPRALEFNDYIQPICLPPAGSDDLGAGVTVTVTGWGKTTDSILGGISDTLNEVDDITITNEECSDYYGNIIIADTMICVSSEGGQGPCNGDSGGPLNYKDDPDGVQVRGLVAFGSSDGCESGAPDSFTRVSHFLDWIQTNTGVTTV